MASYSPLDHFLSLDDEFSVICMQHVVEHLIDPFDFVEIFENKAWSIVAVEVLMTFLACKNIWLKMGISNLPIGFAHRSLNVFYRRLSY